MADIAVASPSSYSSSSAGGKSLEGSFVTSSAIQKLLNGALEGQVHNGQTTSNHANEHEKAPRRKKGEKSTTIQTACVYCKLVLPEETFLWLTRRSHHLAPLAYQQVGEVSEERCSLIEEGQCRLSVFSHAGKMKCIRNNERESCKRCLAAGIDCETKARRSGRRPGSGRRVLPSFSFQIYLIQAGLTM
jgi:hypothetical protein